MPSKWARSPATPRSASLAVWRPGGKLLCCDVSEEYTAIARDAWAAGRPRPTPSSCASRRRSTRCAPSPTDTTFDLAFIDADKGGYAAYYDELLPRVRPGGLLLVDNTLWSGRILDSEADDADTVAIRAFNDLVAADDRVESYVLPVGDGLTLIRRS